MFDVESKQLLHHYSQKAHMSTFIVNSKILTFLEDIPLVIKVSHDGRLFVTTSADKAVKVYDIATKKLLHQFNNVHTGNIT